MDRLGLTVAATKSRDVLRFSSEELNNYYASIIKGRELPLFDEVIAGFVQVRTNAQFTFSHVDVCDVVKCLSVGSSRAEGVDGIPIHVLRTFKGPAWSVDHRSC
ncbi:hypothetical protein KQX54_015895 [Cotesia glomerata]|uniref:Reverse transcriptase n=1 Tax=Cotesia glomerata TaxID=32391 RepID=A0AAV7HX29_COTGL|nr:hypothetical protein KQX54_015895 [Cotesia glomerata]